MTTSGQEKLAENLRSTTISRVQSGPVCAKGSPFVRLEQASRKVLCAPVKPEDRTVFNGLAAVQFGMVRVLVPQEYQYSDTAESSKSNIKGLQPLLLVESKPSTTSSPTSFNNYNDSSGAAPVISKPSSNPDVSESNVVSLLSRQHIAQHYPDIFPQNVNVPLPLVSLPPPSARLETTAQLAYCNSLLHPHLSSSLESARASALDPAQRTSVDAILLDDDEKAQIRWLVIRVVEEFVADGLKTSDKIAEVILLGSFLGQETYRRLLNSFIAEFETTTLLDIDLLQGLVHLVQCAQPDYLLPDDLIRILVVLRARLQETHQQSTTHSYYLTLAISCLLDVMVEGKVQELNRVVNHEPLSALLSQLVNVSDPYLKHQAAYALQALRHVPNDETRRQFMLRHAGNITMGLLGAASVCKLDISGFTEGAGEAVKTVEEVVEVGAKMLGGVQSIRESGQDIFASVKGGVLSGGSLLWYAALREAQDYVCNGRLADFNRLIFEAPCRRDVEFQWGVCKLLGEIAVDSQWEVATRQQAVDLLAALYRDDAIRTSNDEVDSWILQIFRKLVALSDLSLSDYALSVLQSLEKGGSATTQGLYRDIMAGPLSPYPIKASLPVLSTSPLLARVLAIPDVEYDIHTLKHQRMNSHTRSLYIPPQAKPSLKSDETTLFPLMEKVLEFVESHQQVMLLLGDSGAGKSTFSQKLEHTLWTSYKPYGPIPLYINLPTIDNPTQDLIGKELYHQNFSEEQIQELKLHRQFILICDGYDESQLKTNLHTSNAFNQPDQWKVKMVVSCRSQYLGQDYRSRFQPRPTNHYAHATSDLLLEAVIAPFTKVQVEQYVDQYVGELSADDNVHAQPIWTKDEYMERLTKIPKMMELVSNPFLLTLSLEALPEVIGSKKEFSTIRITRVQLYDGFVKRWLEVNKRRLEGSTLSESERSEFDMILDDDFLHHGIKFQKDLAAAIFKEQKGQPIVSYTHLRDNKSWKSSFFSPDAHTKVLRECSTVARSGRHFRFIHRSLLEYFYSRTVYDPLDYDPDASSYDCSVPADPKTQLSQRNFVGEPSVLQFLAERTETDLLFKKQLLAVIEDSKVDEQGGQAGSNAISILVKAETRFNGANLSGIRIPGADLRGGSFDSADLEGADLSGANLSKAWLRQANLNRTRMTGVQFGELPYLRMEKEVLDCVFSYDGELLAVSINETGIDIFSTASWTRIASHPGANVIAISPTTRELAKSRHKSNVVEVGDILTGELRLVLSGHSDEVTSIAFSPDGSLIATASKDTTLQVWSTSSGESLHTLNGHSESVNRVAFSPTGSQLVSCSEDKTLRTWSPQTGELVTVFNGHKRGIVSVSYSPDGRKLASGASNGGIGFWDAETGENTHGFVGHADAVEGLAYSPNGHQLASCGSSGTICLWDPQNGELLNTLTGHLFRVTSVDFSPAGDYIVSSSWDWTVRLWKAGEGESSPDGFSESDTDGWGCVALSLPDGKYIVTGNTDGAICIWETLSGNSIITMTSSTDMIQAVRFSPCGKRVASVSGHDVQLWCAQTGECLRIFKGHTSYGLTVAFSPSGHQLVSGGQDLTLRTWDVETGEPKFILEGHTDAIMEVVYSPSGHQIASCGDDGTARLWNAETGDLLFTMEHPEGLTQAIYSVDGQELVSISPGDGILRYWDPKSGQPIVRQEEIYLNITCCCFSPDGNLIASGDRDGLFRLWDRSTGAFERVFQSMIGLTLEIQWRQDSEGMHNLATIDMGSVRVWKLIEKETGGYSLLLLWSSGRKELSLEDANICGESEGSGAVGLSPNDLELMKQRGAITELKVMDEPADNPAHEE
ncbi:hypothetical protein EC957_003214 [Mortierella hygrophila]|uniref:WD40 repeat-like protein n=1 Tax=Mortierella hygrophila TaxID=979708 RepID=A0A9P6F3S1_9FUNG|nr:hypothetical protein EC957_003214 [Mortierella hygrophila]